VSGYTPPGFVFNSSPSTWITMRSVAKRSIGNCRPEVPKWPIGLFDDGVAVTEMMIPRERDEDQVRPQSRALTFRTRARGRIDRHTSVVALGTVAVSAVNELPRTPLLWPAVNRPLVSLVIAESAS